MPLSSLSCKRKKMAANSLMTEYHDCVNCPYTAFSLEFHNILELRGELFRRKLQWKADKHPLN